MKIVRNIILFLLLSLQIVYAQTRTIEGTVSSKTDGTPIIGASVRVKGTQLGAIANRKGYFQIKRVPEGELILVTSSIGFKTRQDTLREGNSITIVMETSSVEMQEVVVTALGIEKEKRDLGYAVQEVTAADITTTNNSNMLNSLSGKVAGVQISEGASGPGSTSRMVIRGENSLTGDNQPLFVVDGVPIKNSTELRSNVNISNNMRIDYGNGAAEINPDDIESITVLKGPNATALYGSRAANGAVLITTKSGKGQKGLGVEFHSSTSYQSPLTKVQYQDVYGQGKNFQFEFKDGYDGGLYDGVDESWGPKMDGQLIKQFSSPASGTYTYPDGRTVQLRAGDVHGLSYTLGKAGLDLTRRGDITPTPFISRGNPIDLFFETGVTTTNSLSFSSSTPFGDFRLSYTNLDDKGMLPNTDLQRNSISLNMNSKLSDKLEVNGVANYIKTDSKNRHNNGYGTESIMYVFTWWGQNNDMNALQDYWERGLEGFQQYNYNYNYHDNPYFHMYENTNGLFKDHIIGSINAKYSILDNLSVMVRSSLDYYSQLTPIKRAFSTQRFPQGQYREDKASFNEINMDFLLNYYTTFAKDFNLNLSGGGNIMKQNDNYEALSANRLVIPGVYALSNTDIPLISYNERREKQINSLYAVADLDYQNLVFLQVSGRNDWSSTLPKNSNSYFYPSVSLSVIGSDIFQKWFGITLYPLTYGKLRIGWAQSGNDTDPYRLEDIYSFGNPWGQNLLASESSIIANKELKPEIVTSTEIGFDTRFFEDRIGLDFTYYTSDAKNQILGIQIPISSGYQQKLINAGKIHTSGFEVMLSTTPIQLQNSFRWDLNVNFSSNRSEVVELAPGLTTYTIGTNRITLLAKEGERMGTMWGTGLKKTDDGQIIYKDGLPQQDNTLRNLGNYNPDWMAGISNSFSFKGFSLSVLFDIRQGGKFNSGTRLIAATGGNIEESLWGRDPEHGGPHPGIKNSGIEWVDPTDGKTYTDGIIGEGVMVDPNDNGKYIENNVIVHASAYHNTRYKRENEQEGMYDASFVKLREVSLSYTFPQTMLQNIFVKGLRVSVYGRNLALWTDNPHFDPEAISFTGLQMVPGVEDYALPSARSFGFSIDVKF